MEKDRRESRDHEVESVLVAMGRQVPTERRAYRRVKRSMRALLLLVKATLEASQDIAG